MRIYCIAMLASCFCVPAGMAWAAGSDTPDGRQANADTSFPNYSRKDETKSCLFGYGTENSSILDCVARDEKVRDALSKSWSDIDARFRKDCVARLATRHLNSYFYLDRCIGASKRDAAVAD